MKITTLLENTAVDQCLLSQHGLSQYIEVNNRTILLDAGPSEYTVKNAKTLGIDLTKIDTIVLSHGHYDHANGLPAVLEENITAPVYLKPEAQGDQRSGTKEHSKFIGVTPTLYQQYSNRLMEVAEEMDLGDGIVLLPHIQCNPAFVHPQPNLLLQQEDEVIADLFLHELILTIQEKKGVHILTGCSHSGIVSMIETVLARFPDSPILSVTGGFHLAVPHTDDMSCTTEFVNQLGEHLQSLGDFPIFTCHCTGKTAFQHLKSILGSRISYLCGGMTVEV